MEFEEDYSKLIIQAENYIEKEYKFDNGFVPAVYSYKDMMECFINAYRKGLVAKEGKEVKSVKL